MICTDRIGAEPGDHLRRFARDAGARDEPAQDRGRGEQEEHDAGQPHRGGKCGQDVAPGERAVEQHADGDGVDRREGRGFGDRAEPAQDAAEDDHRHEQRRDRGQERAQGESESGLAVHGKSAPPGEIETHRQQRTRQQQAGNDAGDEQRDHRDVVEHGRVHHHDDARRNDRPEDRCAGGDRGRVGRRIAFLLHGRDQQLADRDGIGDRRAGQPGEEQAAGDVDVAQCAAHAAEQGVVEVDQALGQARLVHQLGGEDEVRDRHEQEAAHAREHPVGDDLEELDPADRRRTREAREQHHQADGRADQQYDDEHRQGGGHQSRSASGFSGSSRSRPLTRWIARMMPATGMQAATQRPCTWIWSDTM